MSYSVLSPVRNLTFATAAAVALLGCQSTPGPDVASTVDTAPVSGFLWTAATTSQDAHNYAAAVGYYQSLYTRDPSDIGAALGLARNLRYIGSAEQALDILRAVGLEHPDNPELKAEVGKAQLAVGDVDEAVATLREATTENPEDWQAISALGIAYDQLKDHEMAQAQYRAALEISPKNISVLNNLALSTALSGDLAGGLEILRQVMARRRSGIQVRQNLALLYAMSGDMETAERLIKEDLPVQMAEHNIEFYRRVYPGVAGDHGAAIAREVSPTRQLATADGMSDGVVEQAAPTRVARSDDGDTDDGDTDDGNTDDGNPTAVTAPIAVASRAAVGGVPDIDAAAEPMLRADTDPAPTGVKAVALSAGGPDFDNIAASADAMVGFEVRDDVLAAAYVGDEPSPDADADASRVPIPVAETESDANQASVVAVRQPAIDERLDVDAAAVPVSVDFAGYDVRDDALAALPAEAETASDADAGRAPMLYVDAGSADSGSESGDMPANPVARHLDDDVIGITGSADVMSFALSEFEPLEFDIGMYDEATISGEAIPVPGTVDARPRTALVMANPAIADAAPAEAAEAAAPEEMAETMLSTPSASSLAKGGANAPPVALESVLAGFADAMAVPAKTASSADTQERGAPSFSDAGNQAANTSGPIDQALAGFATQRPANRAMDEAPAEAEETVVAARSPVPPPPTVDSSKAPAAAPVSDDVMIELGAFASLGDATRWLVRLRDSHGALLSGVRFQIKSTDVSQAATRYRLIAGPMENEAVAADLCDRLEGFLEGCGIFNPTGDVAKAKAGLAG